MIVGIDATSLIARHPRGEGRSLLRLYTEIGRLRPTWRFVFFGMSSERDDKAALGHLDNCEVVTFDVPGFRWNTWENVALPFHCWRHRVDILHSASSGAPVWSPVPVLMTVHDLVPMMFDDGLTEDSRRLFAKRLGTGCRVARRIICVSENTRRDLIRFFPDFSHKVAVVPWGIDPVGQELPRHTCDSRSAPLILGLGGGGATRKNVPRMIEAFRLVLREVPDAQLHVLGVTSPKQRADLHAVIRQCGVDGRVTLRDFVTDEELDLCYRQAACVLYCSLYEGFGLPPLEAMARGTPVVASDRSSIPEVVGEAGLLVDPTSPEEIANAVLRVLQDEGLRSKLAIAALARSRKFNWQETAERTITEMESVLAGPK